MSTSAWVCDICGAQGQPVRQRVVEWRMPIGQVRFEHVTICRDEARCRERVMEAGNEWPLLDPEWVRVEA
jgi:hypothetical protein